jgi:hypothetical protein
MLSGRSRGWLKYLHLLHRAAADKAVQAVRLGFPPPAHQEPLGKRLYVFLQGQEGFPHDGPGVYYEIPIDNTLMETAGCRDRHSRRLRVKLARAGREIIDADSRYKEVSIRPGKSRGLHVLRMVRAGS